MLRTSTWPQTNASNAVKIVYHAQLKDATIVSQITLRLRTKHAACVRQVLTLTTILVKTALRDALFVMMLILASRAPTIISFSRTIPARNVHLILTLTLQARNVTHVTPIVPRVLRELVCPVIMGLSYKEEYAYLTAVFKLIPTKAFASRLHPLSSSNKTHLSTLQLRLPTSKI